MEKMPDTRPRRPSSSSSRESPSLILLNRDKVQQILFGVVVAVVTTLFLSSRWHLSRQAESPIAVHRIANVDLDYGLAQCAHNHQRPKVNAKLAATRLMTRPLTGPRTILRNATLVDGDGKVVPECNVEMQSGIFTKVTTGGLDLSELSTSSETVVVDLGGRVVTPGLVDMHSHAGVRETPQLWATEDVTEISAPLTPWGRAIDALKPHDQAISVIASGGVTTSLVLTGAKNQISGEGVVIKMKRAKSIRHLLLDTTETEGKPQRYLKMAMGENQKRQFQGSSTGPVTRIGESYWFRKAYDTARRVKQEQDRWCEMASTAEGRSFIETEYPSSLEWQTLVDVLRGDVQVHAHGYETEDMIAMFDHSDEFGFNITALHHALHADLLLDEIRERNIAVVGFSDSWGDKKELYDVSSYFPKRVADSGIPFVLTRDHPATHGQWLAYEAQIAHQFGLDAELAISSIIAIPARLLGLDNRLGFVRPGYDADLVVWDRHPLRVGATPLQVFIDGNSGVRAADSVWSRSETSAHRRDAPSSRSSSKVESSCEVGQSDIVVRGIQKSFIGDDGLKSDETVGRNLTVVIRSGRVACVGGDRCNDSVKQAVADKVPFLDLANGYVIPGLTIVSRQHGLVEMRQEPSTTDGASTGEDLARPLSSQFGIKFDGVHVERSHRAGVTRIVTPPISNGFFHGISTEFRAGAKSVLDDGAIVVSSAALHFTIGHDAKSPLTPSITSQISKLRDLLTVDKHLNPIYERAAKGKIAVVVSTNNKDVIAHMVALKKETGAHIVILGGGEAHLIASDIAQADVPVIFAPFWGCEPLFWDSRKCLPGPPLTDQLGPQILMDKGAKVAISNWDDTNNHIRNSIWEASWIAGPGNHSLALDLVSKNVEDILRLPRTRDIVIYEGDPFEFGSRIVLMFEEGKVQRCYPDVDENGP